jgi:PAS domain S-box-containing protein
MTVAYESPITIAEADLRLLRLLGDQAAIAIENAHLYEQTQQELIERQQTEADLQQTYSNLQRSNHLLAQILEVGNTLNRNLNLSSLLQEIVQAVHDALGFSVVILNLVEDDRQYVRVGAHTGLDEAGGQLFTEAVYAWTEFANLLQERFQIEGCYFIPHNKFSWEHEFHGPVYTAVSGIDYDGLANSWHPDDALFVPIEIRPGQIKGIISVDQPVNGRRPDVETLRALQIFAQQAAAAIENAHLYEQVQQELAERRQAQEALHQLNAELENRVAERTDELADVNDNLLAEIMERQRVEAALRQSELKYRLLIEQMPAVTYIARLDEIGSSVYVSPQVKSLLGYSAEEWMADTQLWFNLVHPDDRAAIISESQVALAKGQAFRAEYRMFNREGQVVWIQDQTVVLPDEAGQSGLTQGVLVDITARKQAEEQLRMSLHEKEILLKEIHHRVKNNMQIISSLLNLQSSYISDAQALEIFQESQNRVRSMALIHEKLYSSKNLGKIDLGEYVSDLVNHLFRSYKADGKGITLNVQAEDVHLGIDAAVPCGLIINELISNALKHAFPLNSQGEILVELQKNRQRVSLRISDNGLGFPTDLDFQNTPSLGLQLVNTLVRQLDGTIELQNGSGTAFKISFAIQ